MVIAQSQIQGHPKAAVRSVDREILVSAEGDKVQGLRFPIPLHSHQFCSKLYRADPDLAKNVTEREL